MPITTAVCLYVKNEVRSISEWIAYHLVIGFDHVFIYDNKSTDATAFVARSFGPHAVTVIPWPFEDRFAQYKAYEHCLAHARNDFDWVGCIDSDEFLTFQPGHSLQSLLENRDGCDAIAIHWAIFGSDGHEDYPSELTITAFKRRAPSTFGPNRHVKSIVRPKSVTKAESPHTFFANAYELPTRQTPNWQSAGITVSSPDYSVCQINHYFVRSREQWADKIRRGYRDGSRSESEFSHYDTNEVEDALAADQALNVLRRMSDVRPSETYPIPVQAGMFDAPYYLVRYPDIAQSEYPPERHFWDCGLWEQREPNPWFDPAWYGQTYLTDDRRPPFLHFLSEGLARGFLPRREFQTAE